jgi:hypothetical protein
MRNGSWLPREPMPRRRGPQFITKRFRGNVKPRAEASVTAGYRPPAQTSNGHGGLGAAEPFAKQLALFPVP